MTLSFSRFSHQAPDGSLLRTSPIRAQDSSEINGSSSSVPEFDSTVEIKDARILVVVGGDLQRAAELLDYLGTRVGAARHPADQWGCLEPSSAPVRCVTVRVAGVAPKEAARGLVCASAAGRTHSCPQ